MSLFKSAIQTGIRLIKGGANQKRILGTIPKTKGKAGYPDRVESAGVVSQMAKRKGRKK